MADDPREALLAVARDIIDKKGYVGLSLRTAAAAAGVTPEVARRYYRNRDQLFAAALRLPVDPTTAIPTLVAPGVEGMGERLVRFMLDILKDPEARDELVSLARAGVNAGHAASGLQDFLERGVVDRIASMIGVPDARMRAALITSYLLGIAMTRYGVRLDPLASASEEEVIRMVAPVVQDLLDPRKPIPGRPRAHDPQQAERTRATRTFVADPKAQAAAQARPRARGESRPTGGRPTGGSSAATHRPAHAKPDRTGATPGPAPRGHGATRPAARSGDGPHPADPAGPGEGEAPTSEPTAEGPREQPRTPPPREQGSAPGSPDQADGA